MDNVEAFVDQLIDSKGYTTLADDVRAQLKADLMQKLFDQIDRAAINALPEDKAVELAEKLDDPAFTKEDAAKFMQESGVDLQRIALMTILQFRALYIGNEAAENAADAAAENAAETAAAQET